MFSTFVVMAIKVEQKGGFLPVGAREQVQKVAERAKRRNDFFVEIE